MPILLIIAALVLNCSRYRSIQWNGGHNSGRLCIEAQILQLNIYRRRHLNVIRKLGHLIQRIAPICCLLSIPKAQIAQNLILIH